MIRVIGVRLKQNGKIYYFDPVDLDLKAGDELIVETARGIEFGVAASGIKDVQDSELVASLKPVLRVATDEDRVKHQENLEKNKAAMDVCQEKIIKHGLEMKLVDVEYTFDGSKIIFYFTADGRVDFRELVKDLASVYRTRIELRQIGVRDETRTMGGIGVCGREFCCHTFQSDFQPVSIRMAKDQNLSLNPTKIYGACGRLMCCIRYEEETYKELNKNLPKPGDETVTEDGYHAVVNNVNILKQKVKVIVDLGNDEREAREYDADALTYTKKGRAPKKEEVITPEELKILEDMKKDAGEEITKEEKPQRDRNKNRNKREFPANKQKNVKHENRENKEGAEAQAKEENSEKQNNHNNNQRRRPRNNRPRNNKPEAGHNAEAKDNSQPSGE